MRIIWLFFILQCSIVASGQNRVQGYLVNSYGEVLSNYKLSVLDTNTEIYSNAQGYFILEVPEKFKTVELTIISAEGNISKIPLDFSGQSVIDLGRWEISVPKAAEEAESQIDWDALLEQTNQLDRRQIGSLLNAQRDQFLNTVAFQFSPVFYQLRGLNSFYQEVHLNGIPIQSFRNGTPPWNQWGGLNDFTNRGQQSYLGAFSQTYSRGGFLATTKINLKPSSFRSGSKISQAFSNSTYRFRTQFSMIDNHSKKNFGYGLLVSRRWGKEGYQEGTPYDGFSAAVLVEKNWSSMHQSWLTLLYSPTNRGKSAPLTRAVFDLKGRRYNPYWGLQEGQLRNSRRVQTRFPMALLNHRWQFNEDRFLQFNFGFIYGTHGSSRLLYNGHEIQEGVLSGGGRNPDPIYYQYLPSYALRNENNPDYSKAYLLERALIDNGQIDWKSLYFGNQNKNGVARYALYNDIQKLNQKYFSLQYTSDPTKGITYRFGFFGATEKSIFFAQPTDLLGATYLTNYNPYAESELELYYNLLEPHQKILEGGLFQYHYRIQTSNFETTHTIAYNSSGWNAFGSISGAIRWYQRRGLFQNGRFPENSIGAGTTQKFLTYSLKGGVNYALNGRHYLDLKFQYQQQPPSYKNTFVNPRENHFTVPESTFEKNLQLLCSYLWQGEGINLRSRIYWIQRKDIQEVNAYFADGVGGDEAYFIQEITRGIDFKHLGLESSIEVELVPELLLTGVFSLGDFRYANNPEVYLSADFKIEDQNRLSQNKIRALGPSFLKNYFLASGPQQAISLSLSYQDPNFWSISIFGNYFAKSFLDPNPVLRTINFFTDKDGYPFADYSIQEAEKLLKQEQFPSFFTVNTVAGKSWRLGTKYTGFFLSIQNLLDATFITGGYEQGRNINFRSLREDVSRTHPLFSPKYWWGRGTTYFISTYLRF